MPWIEVKPMDAKILFISDWIRGQYNISELCRRHRISRKTGYKWINRYQEMGVDGLQDQSRRPAHSPEQVSYTTRKEIIAIRKKHKTWGARKIGQVMRKAHGDWDIPSHTTINKVLKQKGLLSPQRRRQRVPVHTGPLSPADQPNELWTVDFKGQFKTNDGVYCYPLTVMDHASRYLLGCEGFYGTRYKETRKSFEKLFREHGLPDRIRSDNGVPFASKSIGGLSRLSIWWIRLGILPERIEPGKPQQNGRHERMHRTLKQETARPPARNMEQQQKRLNAFRKQYNEVRPHEGLDLHSPASVYRQSERSFPKRLPEMTYPGHFREGLVNHNGCVYIKNNQYYIGYLLRGELLGLEEIDDGVWKVYFGPMLLGEVREHMEKVCNKSVTYVPLRFCNLCP